MGTTESTTTNTHTNTNAYTEQQAPRGISQKQCENAVKRVMACKSLRALMSAIKQEHGPLPIICAEETCVCVCMYVCGVCACVCACVCVCVCACVCVRAMYDV